MANAWDADSAAILQKAGIKAIGTSTAGMAYSQYLPDNRGVDTMERPFAKPPKWSMSLIYRLALTVKTVRPMIVE
jgi:hypothetical protein